ncbi:MAG TPA: DUF6188 family protein [Gemmatimonadaceae bacterium]|nr:DUF6188 family protein [Gemmatimonadaceae bacterium]
MSATLDATPQQHSWTFEEHCVTQLIIEPGAVRLATWTLQASAEIRLDTPFRFVEGDGTARRIDPEEPELLAPLLTLVGRTVHGLVVTIAGELEVSFGDGSRLSAWPHPRHEAWQVSGGGALEGMAYVCAIGGGVPWGEEAG